MYLLLKHSLLRQHSTPRSASPIPVPRPPRTSPYWDRHFQILDPRQCFGSVGPSVAYGLRFPQGLHKEERRRKKKEKWRTDPRYSESAALIPRPHGWQSQTPAVSHVHIARCIISEARGISALWGGLTRRPMGCFWHGIQSRRCLSRMTAGAGGFIAQF